MKPETRTRSAWIKLRVTAQEKAAISAKAAGQGQTMADFLRGRALNYRPRQTPDDKERLRQLARIGVNLNHLARWANTHKSRAEALQVLLALTSLEDELKALTKSRPADNQDAPCT